MEDMQFDNPGYMEFGNNTYEDNNIIPPNLSNAIPSHDSLENGDVEQFMNSEGEYDALAYDNPAYSNGQLSFSTFKS